MAVLWVGIDVAREKWIGHGYLNGHGRIERRKGQIRIHSRLSAHSKEKPPEEAASSPGRFYAIRGAAPTTYFD